MAKVFRLQTEIARLKSDVQKLGGARDTTELRHRVGQAIQSIQESAQQIKAELLAANRAAKSQQTAKILADFEVCLLHRCGPQWSAAF